MENGIELGNCYTVKCEQTILTPNSYSILRLDIKEEQPPAKKNTTAKKYIKGLTKIKKHNGR